VAQAIARRLAPESEFDPATFVIRASNVAIGGFFFPALPPARSCAVMEFFERHVNSAAGDAVLMLVPVRGSAAAAPLRSFAAKRAGHGPRILMAQGAR
jgi:hypothetical protein